MLVAPNLNNLRIPDDGGAGYQLNDNEVHSADGLTDVYFKDLQKHLIERIRKAEVVIGCVAWLTSFPILEALSKTTGVSIIVQKEDFLRPDVGDYNGWKYKLRHAYKKLPKLLDRFWFDDTILSHMSTFGDSSIDPVRCVGNHNADKGVLPRSHHKFVLFCDLMETIHGDVYCAPYEVWTGSFNFTQNATLSFENAIVLRDINIVRAFYREYAQVAALSEPLDWQSRWAAPEWRIGT